MKILRPISTVLLALCAICSAHCSERNSAASRKGRDGDKAEHTVVGSEVTVLVGGTTDMTYNMAGTAEPGGGGEGFSPPFLSKK